MAQVSNEQGVEVPNIVHRRDDGNSYIKFTPETPGPHFIKIFVDGQELPGTSSCFFCD